MRNEIKKILKEYSEQGEISLQEYNENQVKRINQLYPKIVRFFERRYLNSLAKLTKEEHRVLYASEGYRGIGIRFDFYFNELPDGIKYPADLKYEIFDTIEEYFGIDWKKYGNPLDVRFYISKWKEF